MGKGILTPSCTILVMLSVSWGGTCPSAMPLVMLGLALGGLSVSSAVLNAGYEMVSC